MESLHSPVVVAALLGLVILLSEKLSKTKVGKAFGTALLVIILAAVLANLTIIPSASNSIELYGHIFHYIAPISIFFLTLGVNLQKVRRAGLPMLLLFLVGSLGTIVGVFVAVIIVSPENVLGDSADAIAGMIAGTYTGGSINFNAIALHYKINESGVLYAGTVAADNVMTTIWILVTIAIPKVMQKIWPIQQTSTKETEPQKITGSEQPAKSMERASPSESLTLSSLMVLIPTALLAFIFSEWISAIWPVVPSILVVTTIGLVLAQFRFFHELSGSHLLGLYLVYLFLAVIGAYCEFAAIHKLGDIGLTLLLFVIVVVLIHGVVTVLLGRFIAKDDEMIAIASQANIGGGTTAMALAETFGRRELIVPAILIGTVGNALGTYLGFMVVGIL